MSIKRVFAYVGPHQLYSTMLECQIAWDACAIEAEMAKLPCGYLLDASKNPVKWAVFFQQMAERQAEARAVDEAIAAGKGAA